MVDRAVSAISCLFLGKTNRDTPIFQHGVQLYNSAMRQVSNMIRQGILTNEILYTVAIFQEINVWMIGISLHSFRLTYIISPGTV